MKKDIKIWKLSLCTIPLLLCILFSAGLFQQAALIRDRLDPEDGIPSSILEYIEPGTGVLLMLAYGLSVGILLLALREYLRK